MSASQARSASKGSGSALERRKLSFASLDEVVADAENLLARGYDRAGNWTLAQVSGHLAEWMRFPLDGPPRIPLLVRPVVWLMRVTVGGRMRRAILERGFTPGKPTFRETVPPVESEDAAGVARLREVVGRWKTHTGELFPSPLFGRMDRETWVRLQLRHCEHHLSFLVPRPASPSE